MTSFEESNPRDVSLEIVHRALRRFFPEIQGSYIRFHYHGTYNVFEVKGEYIFRFPDRSLFNEEGLRLIMRENEVLELLRPHLTVEIPRFLFLSEDPETPFVGYRKIPGVSLSRCFEGASREQRRSIAEWLGGFLTELHSDRVLAEFMERFPSDFTLDWYRRYWERWLHEIREKVFPVLNPQQRGWASELVEGFIGDSDNFLFTPRVVHGDFDTSNVLVDPGSYDVTGVIDFEEARIWDPAADLLFFWEGESFIEDLLNSYSLPLGPNLDERRTFLTKRTPFIYIMWGLEHEHRGMVDAGFEMLENRMRAH
ncbi:MAG: aminoglycoside phosphotransferase family protein [Candidatus Bathyarchaeota archaeon]|nr:MAG: aminoglycoside phosphotransferase family protein [Candidatus Bathyarchaeota archaeon]